MGWLSRLNPFRESVSSTPTPEQAIRLLEERLKTLTESTSVADRLVMPWERFLDGDRLLFPSGFNQDRKAGRDWPTITTEVDLRSARAFCRLIASTNPLVIGFLDHITNFVVGTGYKWHVGLKGVQGNKDDKDPAVIQAQRVLDDFRALNGWGDTGEVSIGDDIGEDDSPATDLEAEAYRSAMRDGEFFLRLFPGDASTNGIPHARRVNPECVTCPSQDQLGPWSWGIETDPQDRQRRLRYHVTDPDKLDVIGEFVPAGEMVHFRLNVDSDVKRGLPDFWPLQDEVQHLRNVWRNMAEVTAIQAAIAYIRQHAPGVTGAQIANLIDRTKSGLDYTGKSLTDTEQGADRFRTFNRHEAGTIIDVTNQMQFLPGPMSTGAPGFVTAMQAVLRIVGLRWGCPEYFSGDSSNANFASTLVAGGPFERATQRRQRAFRMFQGNVATRALLFAAKAGRLRREDLSRLSIAIDPPAVAIANKSEDTQRRATLYQAGVLDKHTWISEEGMDPETVLARRKQEDAEAAQQQPPPGMGGGMDGAPVPGGDQPPDQGGGMDLATLLGESKRRINTALREAAPGPPPRPGLVWNDQTHRWRDPETQTFYAHPRGHQNIPGTSTIDMHLPAMRAVDRLYTAVRKGADESVKEDAASRATRYGQMAARKIIAAISATAIQHLPESVVVDYATDYTNGFLKSAYFDYVEDVQALADADSTDRDEVREAASSAGTSLELLLKLADGFLEYIKQQERHRPDHPDDPYHKPRAESADGPPPDGYDAEGPYWLPRLSEARTRLLSEIDPPDGYMPDGTAFYFEDRSGLVKKVITNKAGRKQTVYVRPNTDKAAGADASVAAVVDSRTAVATAVGQVDRLTMSQFHRLNDHISNLSRDEIRGHLKTLGEKIGGKKVELAQRLLERVRAEQGKTEPAMQPRPEPAEQSTRIPVHSDQNSVSIPGQGTQPATPEPETKAMTTTELPTTKANQTGPGVYKIPVEVRIDTDDFGQGVVTRKVDATKLPKSGEWYHGAVVASVEKKGRSYHVTTREPTEVESLAAKVRAIQSEIYSGYDGGRGDVTGPDAELDFDLLAARHDLEGAKLRQRKASAAEIAKHEASKPLRLNAYLGVLKGLPYKAMAMVGDRVLFKTPQYDATNYAAGYVRDIAAGNASDTTLTAEAAGKIVAAMDAAKVSGTAAYGVRYVNGVPQKGEEEPTRIPVDSNQSSGSIPGQGTQPATPQPETKAMTTTELPKLKGSEKQVNWAEGIRSQAMAFGSDPDADETTLAAVAAVAAMTHAKMIIDIRDAAGDLGSLESAYTDGQQIAQAIRDNAGKVKENDIDTVLGRVNPESAAFAFAALDPTTSTYEGYGQTARPWFKFWLTGKYPLPAVGGAN